MVSVVIVCAGNATRMGQNKMEIILEKKPVWEHTLAAFDNCDCIDEIVMVATQSLCPALEQAKKKYKKLSRVVQGGDSRQASVANGIEALSAHCQYVGVHDGARPFVTHGLIRRAVADAQQYGACVPGVSVKDTIKVVGPGGLIENTPDRNHLVACQTPQVFAMDIYTNALAVAQETGMAFTDDAGMVEAAGFPVHVCQGDDENIKLTTPGDVRLGLDILKRRKK